MEFPWQSIAEHDELCVLSERTWKSLWSMPYGPVPNSLDFLCDLSGPAPGEYLKLPSERCWIEKAQYAE